MEVEFFKGNHIDVFYAYGNTDWSRGLKIAPDWDTAEWRPQVPSLKMRWGSTTRSGCRNCTPPHSRGTRIGPIRILPTQHQQW